MKKTGSCQFGMSNNNSDHFILVFHGAEVFDTGDASTFIRLLNPEKSIVAGVMARTAAGESGLEVIYDGRRPSEILSQYGAHEAVLVHRAKNSVSAHRFGSIIHSHLEERGLIFIEPGTGQILVYGSVEMSCIRWLKEKTGYIIVNGERHKDNPPGMRRIGGCLPGEPVFVNGIIIGHATNEEVVISLQDGAIEAVSGILIKEHGIEKLMRSGCPDIQKAWCKSGHIRLSFPKKGDNQRKRGKIAVIDHKAMACYDCFGFDICGILAIGDDTTSICGHIGCSRGIPVLGITDGDIDGIVPEGYAPGSVVLLAVNERDDELGREIVKMVPEYQVIWNEWVHEIISKLGDRVRIVHHEYGFIQNEQ